MLKKMLSLTMAIVILLSTAPAMAAGIQDVELLELSDIENSDKPKEIIFSEGDRFVKRYSGINRYQTAINLNDSFFVQADRAVIASGEGFADALFGGPFADQIYAPLLLTGRDELPDGLLNLLNNLNVRLIYLLGGESSISLEVEKQLVDNGFLVDRIAGEDRYKTASLISLKAGLLRGIQVMPDYCVQVSGTGFADALSAAPFVSWFYKEKFGYYLPYVESHAERSGDLIIGGYSSIPKGNEHERISGTDRYDTAVQLAKAFKTKLEIVPEAVVIVDGTKYPDALAAGPIAASKKCPILLTKPDELYGAAGEFIMENKIKKIYIVGGESSVSKRLEEQLTEIIKGLPQ